MYLFSISYCENEKRKYAHTINQSFIRIKTLMTVLIRRKRRLYDTFFRMKINKLYPNFDYRSMMTKKTLRNINQSNQSWARQGDRNLFSETQHSLINQQTNKQRKVGKNTFQRWEIDPRRINAA